MEDDGGGGGGGRRSLRYEFSREPNGSTAGVTLGGILSIKETSSYRIQNRTLLDLIRNDPTSGNESNDSKKSWKMFREKLRLKLAGSVCTTTTPILASLVHINTDNNVPVTQPVNSTDRLNVRGEPPVEEYERTTTAEESRDGGDGGGAETVKMSLMSLLEVEGSAYFDEEEVAAGGGGGGGGEYNNCCVCMVRHKGAAFIPCGHTFCRLCSRELFVKRANCPLCNNFILEILDIF
ncbi:putative transcription factor C2H2 family [Helianthus annuus]|nr:putative transcription factor C2H2 family [Helianthus annuus]